MAEFLISCQRNDVHDQMIYDAQLLTHLESERGELQEELEREEDGEDDVEHVEEVCVALGLPVELHGETEGIDAIKVH